ncbi:hypothetical protein JCM3765_006891 [Sporobolomyces pararoseus]
MPSHTPVRSSSSSMPPPPLPLAHSAEEYSTMIQLAQQLGERTSHSTAITGQRLRALELLYSISRRQWKDMNEAETRMENERLSWTEKVVRSLELALRHPSQMLELVTIVKEFKRTSKARLLIQSTRTEGLDNLHLSASQIPQSRSKELRCTKRSLLLLRPAHYATLFLHEDENGSFVDGILRHLSSIASMVAGATRLAHSQATEDEMKEELDLIEKAETEAGKICELCATALTDQWYHIWNAEAIELGLSRRFIYGAANEDSGSDSSFSLPHRPPFSPINRCSRRLHYPSIFTSSICA